MAEAARSASLQAEARSGHKGHNAEGQTQGAWKGLKLGLCCGRRHGRKKGSCHIKVASCARAQGVRA